MNGFKSFFLDWLLACAMIYLVVNANEVTTWLDRFFAS